MATLTYSVLQLITSTIRNCQSPSKEKGPLTGNRVSGLILEIVPLDFTIFLDEIHTNQSVS